MFGVGGESADSPSLFERRFVAIAAFPAPVVERDEIADRFRQISEHGHMPSAFRTAVPPAVLIRNIQYNLLAQGLAPGTAIPILGRGRQLL